MRGLTTHEVRNLQVKYQKNTPPQGPKVTFMRRILSGLGELFSLFLLAAALIALILGEWVNALLILIVVIANVLFTAYQENKADDALAHLRSLSSEICRVIRDGVEQQIDPVELVPGDIVLVEEGSKIPADATVLSSTHLQVNEASLTGESVAVIKAAKDTVYSGTVVASGRATLQVIATGAESAMGKIATSLQSVHEELTPLQKKVLQLSRVFAVIGIIAAFVIFILSYLAGSSLYVSLLLGISIAVAVVPEALPITMTIALTLGSHTMSRHGAIVRRISAVEALGGVTIIATDKTGTLTTGVMRVSEISGDEKHILECAIVCSTAVLNTGYKSQPTILGDQTEGALLLYAHEKGIAVSDVRESYTIVDEVPFDTVTKLMHMHVISPTKKKVQFTKGSPEAVFALCKLLVNHKARDEFRLLASRGLRVVAFAVDRHFVGLAALHDPPRHEAREAIQQAKLLGVRTIMITGDSELTATHIATQVGLMEPGDMTMLGTEIDTHDDEGLMEILPRVRIFARTNAHQKARLVGLLQRSGEQVAVTGDGVNDAIALKAAEVGIAMGNIGTDVAKDVADIVLTDDNYATIVVAIREGRTIISHIRKVVIYLFSTNAIEIMAIIALFATGQFSVFTPIQLLYLNLLTDAIPALVFVFAPATADRIGRGHKREGFMPPRYIIYMTAMALWSTVLIVLGYFMGAAYGISHMTAFLVLVSAQLGIFTDLWGKYDRYFAIGLGVPILLQLVLLQLPVVQDVFRIEPISFSIMIGIMAFATVATALFGTIVRFICRYLPTTYS